MNALNLLSKNAFIVVACGAALAGATAANAAAAPAYNPRHLDQTELNRVSSICQSAMGLRANEPPIPGSGDPRLTPSENHFQGCVASLSTSLQAVERAKANARVTEACEAKGAAAGSPTLAKCVLQAVDDRKAAGPAPATALTPIADHGEPKRSFFLIGAQETHRRIAQSCAELGISPATGMFDSCVKDMKDTFYAIDNPWN